MKLLILLLVCFNMNAQFKQRLIPMPSCQYYIEFTNDNWKTVHKLNQTFDLTSVMGKLYVIYQPIIGRESEMRALAKNFNYKKSIQHNIKEYKKKINIISYWKKHKIPQKKKQKCGGNIIDI